MKKTFLKYREIILYIFFGGCTTIVNVILYYISTRWFGFGIVVSTLLAWWVSVLFAYITNRILVFRSHNKEVRAILFEFAFFVACRLLTGLLDIFIMYLFVDRLGWYDLMMKFLSNLIVILVNYVASRVFIFKKHSHRRQVKSE
ncbi:MAG: putative cell wall teichoic acid glycosylation protein [Herbinix sp.]|jgi:putative flippase GtrA|nr:putative cell wall teichoic acid glycosylation protein [Herbinix sp.]